MNAINGTTTPGLAPGANVTMATIARVDANATTTPEVAALTVTPDPAQGHRQVGNLSAEALQQSIEATADDVTAAGRAVVEVAADIMREATEIADGIRRCGAAFAQHVMEFATLAQQVSDTMRSTRGHVLGGPEVAPSPAPRQGG